MSDKLNMLSLFSGIGGMDLGFEQASGFRTVAMCDNNPDRCADLTRLFPGVKVYDDVSTLSATRLQADGISRPDVICGGFPCQDISVANPNAKGLAGERSGLWFEYARLIEETQPDWIVIENSPRLRHLGLGTILRFLHAQRYDAFWDGIPARAVGAYHQRDRLFIVANANGRLGRTGAVVPFDGGTGAREMIRRLLPTLTARDWRSGKASDATLAKNSRPLNETLLALGKAGRANAEWLELFMMFPQRWTDPTAARGELSGKVACTLLETLAFRVYARPSAGQ